MLFTTSSRRSLLLLLSFLCPLHPLKERAKADEDGGDVDAGSDKDDNANDDDGDESDEGLQAAAEQDGLQSEVLRGKSMDVASMDALKKRIEVRRTGLSVS